MTIGSSLCALAAASFRDLPDLSVILLTLSFNFASVTCAIFLFFFFFIVSVFLSSARRFFLSMYIAPALSPSYSIFLPLIFSFSYLRCLTASSYPRYVCASLGSLFFSFFSYHLPDTAPDFFRSTPGFPWRLRSPLRPFASSFPKFF